MIPLQTHVDSNWMKTQQLLFSDPAHCLILNRSVEIVWVAVAVCLCNEERKCCGPQGLLWHPGGDEGVFGGRDQVRLPQTGHEVPSRQKPQRPRGC